MMSCVSSSGVVRTAKGGDMSKKKDKKKKKGKKGKKK
jgi:hypothetical protein